MELQEIEEDQIVKEGRVGEGPFTIVFRGTCRGQDVAIHLLKKQNLNKEEVASFKAQVKALSKMRNKHIVVLLGVVTTPGRLALVTEWMPNTMAALCFEHSPIGLSLYERLKMAKDAALGVYWLHCSKTPLYHSNLKLSNFLVAEDGSVKVSDFGLLDMRLSSSAKQSSPTTYWQEDPPVRMAPEYLTRSSAYDEKCDVYSFGLCLYEVLTGKEAFRKLKKRLLQQKKSASNNNNDDKEAVTRRILEEVIEVVVEEEMRPVLPQDVPPRLADLIRCCWHPLPNCRPNFADILRVLDELILETAIMDHSGRKFWRNNFYGRTEVQWGDFVRALCQMFDLRPPDTLLNNTNEQDDEDDSEDETWNSQYTTSQAYNNSADTFSFPTDSVDSSFAALPSSLTNNKFPSSAYSLQQQQQRRGGGGEKSYYNNYYDSGYSGGASSNNWEGSSTGSIYGPDAPPSFSSLAARQIQHQQSHLRPLSARLPSRSTSPLGDVGNERQTTTTMMMDSAGATISTSPNNNNSRNKDWERGVDDIYWKCLHRMVTKDAASSSSSSSASSVAASSVAAFSASSFAASSNAFGGGGAKGETGGGKGDGGGVPSSTAVVTMDAFGSNLAWFGPLSVLTGEPYLSRLYKIMKQPWFHGDISAAKAEERLGHQPAGSFLIRFSSKPGHFTITSVNKRKKIIHQRVDYIPGQFYVFGDSKYKTLKKLIRMERDQCWLKQPCPGSQFATLFPKDKQAPNQPMSADYLLPASGGAAKDS
ncbi:SH2 domain-containing protein, variant 2 [Balamuthia mandrillaris]